MIEICPICGRYSLTEEYPPKPCPICEEELSNNTAIPFPPPISRVSQLRHVSEQRTDA